MMLNHLDKIQANFIMKYSVQQQIVLYTCRSCMWHTGHCIGTCMSLEGWHLSIFLFFEQYVPSTFICTQVVPHAKVFLLTIMYKVYFKKSSQLKDFKKQNYWYVFIPFIWNHSLLNTLWVLFIGFWYKILTNKKYTRCRCLYILQA